MVTFFVGSDTLKIGNQDLCLDSCMGLWECLNGGVEKLVTYLDREGGLPRKNSVNLEVTKYPGNHPVTDIASNEVTKYPKN